LVLFFNSFISMFKWRFFPLTEGLKNDPNRTTSAAVRHFMGRGLDAWGPAGTDFLRVLGAHEGEGLLVEREAQAAGSGDGGGAAGMTKGQRADVRIVEVALFFLREIEAARSPMAAAASEECDANGVARMPVLLLSADNGQVQLARSHGLPAAKMTDLAVLEPQLRRVTAGDTELLTAGLLRDALGHVATTGLGSSCPVRSLQREFDGAVACLRLATDALEEALAALATATGAERSPAVVAAVDGSGEDALVLALRRRLQSWESVVRSHQDPSRVLQWAAMVSST
jgi:hypothetical protein